MLVSAPHHRLGIQSMLENLDAVYRGLFSSWIHELNNPLAAIRIYAQTAAMDTDPLSPASGAVYAISEDVARMGELTAAYADFLLPAPGIDVSSSRDIVERTLLLCRTLARKRGVELVAEPVREPVYVAVPFSLAVRALTFSVVASCLAGLGGCTLTLFAKRGPARGQVFMEGVTSAGVLPANTREEIRDALRSLVFDAKITLVEPAEALFRLVFPAPNA